MSIREIQPKTEEGREIVQRLKKEMYSLFEDFNTTRFSRMSERTLKKRANEWYNRIDEGILIYSRILNISFKGVCKKVGLNYNLFELLRDDGTLRVVLKIKQKLNTKAILR